LGDDPAADPVDAAVALVLAQRPPLTDDAIALLRRLGFPGS
jgi:hypothetical protein